MVKYIYLGGRCLEFVPRPINFQEDREEALYRNTGAEVNTVKTSVHGALRRHRYSFLGTGGTLRCYTEGFCNHLLDCYEGRGSFPHQLRQKVHIDPRSSDRLIFSQMDLGDIWLESGIHKAWDYIYSNRHLEIPNSWLECIRDFDTQLKSSVP